MSWTSRAGHLAPSRASTSTRRSRPGHRTVSGSRSLRGAAKAASCTRFARRAGSPSRSRRRQRSTCSRCGRRTAAGLSRCEARHNRCASRWLRRAGRVGVDPSAGGRATVIGTAQGRAAPHFSRDSSRLYPTAAARAGLDSLGWERLRASPRARCTVPGAGPGGPTGAPAALVKTHPLATKRSFRWQTTLRRLGSIRGRGSDSSLPIRQASGLPARRLTDVGANPPWSGDGRRVHWSIGSRTSCTISSARVR